MRSLDKQFARNASRALLDDDASDFFSDQELYNEWNEEERAIAKQEREGYRYREIYA